MSIDAVAVIEMWVGKNSTDPKCALCLSWNNTIGDTCYVLWRGQGNIHPPHAVTMIGRLDFFHELIL